LTLKNYTLFNMNQSRISLLKLYITNITVRGHPPRKILYVTTQLVTPLNTEKREEESVSVNIYYLQVFDKRKLHYYITNSSTKH